MSEYLTYILWRQREQTLPRELERQRVVEERLAHQENKFREEPVPQKSASVPDASAAASVPVIEANLEPIN